MNIIKSEFSRFDRQIREAEQQELNRMNASEETLQDYFDSKRRTELSRKPLKSMDWNEIHELAELRKSIVEDQLYDPNASNPSPEDLQAEIMRVVDACESAAEINRPDLVPAFQSLRKLLNQSRLGTSNTARDSARQEPEEIADEEPVSISKSDNMVIEGFASSNVLDTQDHIVPMQALKQALPEFLEHGTVMLGHGNRPVGKVIYHTFRKTNNGNDGLFIRVHLFKGCEDVAREIGKTIFGFSIGGYSTLKENCNAARCHKDITNLKLYEISLVPHGANKEATIALERDIEPHSSLTYDEACAHLERELGRKPTRIECNRYYAARK